MANMLVVALGGAIGAMLRYSISLIPVKTTFPILTLITNVAGAFIIGMVVSIASHHAVSDQVVLFLKTGICGAFTTFSTFSLESYNLFKDGKAGLALSYALLSLVLCIGAVGLGMTCLRSE